MRWVALLSAVSLLVLAGLAVWEGWALDEAARERARTARVLRALAQVQRASWAAVEAAKSGDTTRLRISESTAGELLDEIISEVGPSPESKELGRAWGAFRQALRAGKGAQRRYVELVDAAEALADRLVSEPSKGRRAFGLSVVVALAALGIWALATYLLAVKPARALAAEAGRMALGDLDEPVRVRAWGSLRRAAEALERLRQNLLELRKQVRRLVGGR